MPSEIGVTTPITPPKPTGPLSTGPGPLQFQVAKLDNRAALPFRAYPSDAGWDLCALILTQDGKPSKTMVPSRGVRTIRTGLALRPPPGHVILCCSRSGLAQKSIFVANSPGVIDPEYTGDISVILFNGGYEVCWIEHGQRIAQVVVVPLPQVELALVERLPKTARGEAGFGSTGA